MAYFSQKLNFLYNLVLNFKDYLEKWDNTLTEGKKLLEQITNNFTELRVLNENKRKNSQIFLIIDEEIIEAKSQNIVKLLDQASSLLKKFSAIGEVFSKQSENLKQVLAEVLEKDSEILDERFTLLTKISISTESLSTMIKNELQLKETVIDNLIRKLFQKDPDHQDFNEIKLFLQLWIFSPYIKDSEFDHIHTLLSQVSKNLFRL